MTIDTFFITYNGRFIDFDGKYGFQCVDLIRQYIKEVLGWEPYAALPTTGNAKDIFNKFPDGGNKYFTKIKNSPTNVPKKGDIIFWKTSYWYPWLYGWAGHTAVVSVAWLMGLNVFGQNYPTKSFCKFATHTYKDCLGWLRPRKV